MLNKLFAKVIQSSQSLISDYGANHAAIREWIGGVCVYVCMHACTAKRMEEEEKKLMNRLKLELFLRTLFLEKKNPGMIVVTEHCLTRDYDHFVFVKYIPVCSYLLTYVDQLVANSVSPRTD